MIKNVYLDTNVFDHMYKKVGVSESDLLALDYVVKTGKIFILLSIVNLEEALCALQSCPELAMAELQLILGLTDRRRLTHWTGLQQCAAMCREKASRWSDTMATTQIRREGLGKKLR